MLSIDLVNFSNCPESAYSLSNYQLIRLSLLGQMDELVVMDVYGHVHLACLHRDKLPRRLWSC